MAGLLLCGTVIGALGVLNDVTVTQAVAVFEISSADPTLTRRRLFRSGMRIGRDHIASTVYSLVLAYAGAALPVLLLFAVTDQAVGNVLSSDALGPAIVAGLIGAIALVLVVPLTTAIATAVAPQKLLWNLLRPDVVGVVDQVVREVLDEGLDGEDRAVRAPPGTVELAGRTLRIVSLIWSAASASSTRTRAGSCSQ